MALYVVNGGSVVSQADINQFTNLLNGTTTGVQITNAGRIRAQLTGATSGSGGYVGQVASAAPASGTFVAGDYAIDGTLGTEWVCTVGGTPGTWVALPTQIATTTLGSNAASVTFSSIPAWTRLVLYWRARTSASGQVALQMQIDGNTGNNYLWSDTQNSAGTVTGSHSGTAVAFIVIGSVDGNTAAFFGSGMQAIDGWGTSTGAMTCSGHSNSFSTITTDVGAVTGGLFSPVGPHTSIKIFPASNNLVTGSQFSLYGYM